MAVVGILLVLTILSIAVFVNVKQFVNSKITLNFQISLEQDYKGSEILSLLSTFLTKTGGLRHSEAVSNVVVNDTENLNKAGLKSVQNTIKKMDEIENKNFSVAVNYAGKSFEVVNKPGGDTYKITTPLPGGEIGLIVVGKTI